MHVFFCVSKNVSVSCAYTQGKREQFSGFNRTLDAINNVFRKFSAFHDETGRLNVDGMNIISNDGSNKLNRSRKARVSYKVQRTINAKVVSVGADIAFDADPKFFACLVRFESSSVPTTLPTAYDVYPLDGRHDGGYYTVKDCVTIDVLPRTPGNNVYVGFMVWSNFTATKCR